MPVLKKRWAPVVFNQTKRYIKERNWTDLVEVWLFEFSEDPITRIQEEGPDKGRDSEIDYLTGLSCLLQLHIFERGFYARD